MELGMLYEIDVPQPWATAHPWGQREGERTAYRNCIEQIVLADKVGFDTVWCVEHHFREGRSHMPCNTAVLAALSQITERIKLGFGVTLAPHEFIHPARLAEHVATVDLLSRGRVQWGLGRSTPMEQMAFGVDVPRSKEKMRAAAKTVVGMWEAEYYEEHSEFLDFPSRMVTPKPYQYPHPPVWQAAVTAGSAEQAGRDGLGMLCFAIMQPLAKLKEVIDAYRNAQGTAEPLTSVTTNKVGVYTLVHCAESRDLFAQNRVWDSVWWWYRSLAEFTLKWEFAHLAEEDRDRLFPLLEQQRKGELDIAQIDSEDMVILGTPDECIKKFLNYQKHGVDQVLCYLNFGYLPQEAVLKSIELLGRHVIPALKQAGANGIAGNLEKSVQEAAAAHSA